MNATRKAMRLHTLLPATHESVVASVPCSASLAFFNKRQKEDSDADLDMERADSLISTRTAKSAATTDDGRPWGGHSEHSASFTPPWAAPSRARRLSQPGRVSEAGRTSEAAATTESSDAGAAVYASGRHGQTPLDSYNVRASITADEC